MQWLRNLMSGESRRTAQKKRNVQRRSVRRPLLFETLEDRLLLSADLILPAGIGGPEPAVAVNPLNPATIVASQFNATTTSTNGGATFAPPVAGTVPPAQAAMSPPYAAAGDPSLAFDSAGRLFWAHLTTQDLNGNNLVDRTEDLSVVVQPVTPVGTAVDLTPGVQHDDKPWIAADSNPLSPFHDNLYVVWSRLVFNATTGREDLASVQFSRSTDQGVTWSAPTQLNANTEGYVWPSEVAVGANATSGSPGTPTRLKALGLPAEFRCGARSMEGRISRPRSVRFRRGPPTSRPTTPGGYPLPVPGSRTYVPGCKARSSHASFWIPSVRGVFTS